MRNEHLNANNYFNIINGVPKPVFRYQTGSGTLGGPIGPAGQTSNKWFFFFNREDWKTYEPRNVTRITVPTEHERQGIFSQSIDTSNRLIFIRDPSLPGACSATAGGPACFPGNVVPANRQNALGVAIMNMIPLPNSSRTGRSAWQLQLSVPDIARQTRCRNQIKLDFFRRSATTSRAQAHMFDPRTAYSGIFGWAANFLQFPRQLRQARDEYQGNVRTFGTKIVNEMRQLRRAREDIRTWTSRRCR
jgi:hypothetical protein